MARPTFTEMIDLDLPMALAVMDALPRLDDGARAADAALGQMLRTLFPIRR